MIKEYIENTHDTAEKKIPEINEKIKDMPKEL